MTRSSTSESKAELENELNLLEAKAEVAKDPVLSKPVSEMTPEEQWAKLAAYKPAWWGSDEANTMVNEVAAGQLAKASKGGQP